MSNPGEVSFNLGDTKVTMVCTRKALKGLSTLYPSLFDLSMQCAQFNLKAICDVIQVGANGDDSEREMLENAVYEAGVNTVSGHTVRYLTLLFNGGREPAKNTRSAGKGDKNPNG